MINSNNKYLETDYVNMVLARFIIYILRNNIFIQFYFNLPIRNEKIFYYC